MNINNIIASILVGAILFFNSIECLAQKKSKLNFGAYSTTLFRDSGSDRFFDGQMFFVSYEYVFAKTIGATIGLNTLSAMNTKSSFGGLSRYLYYHTEVTAGTNLIIMDSELYLFDITIGPTIRNRKEVDHILSVETELGDLTLDEYQNKWDLGFFLKFELSKMFRKRYYIDLSSGITTYNNEESIFYAGAGMSIKL